MVLCGGYLANVSTPNRGVNIFTAHCIADLDNSAVHVTDLIRQLTAARLLLHVFGIGTRSEMAELGSGISSSREIFGTSARKTWVGVSTAEGDKATAAILLLWSFTEWLVKLAVEMRDIQLIHKWHIYTINCKYTRAIRMMQQRHGFDHFTVQNGWNTYIKGIDVGWRFHINQLQL